MKKLIFMFVILFCCKAGMAEEEYTLPAGDWSTETYIAAELHIEPSLTFQSVTFSWGNEKLEIEYGEDASISEAAKQFFEFLRMYIEQEYVITKKE